MRFQCPLCAAEIHATEESKGGSIVCGKCHQTVKIPADRLAPGVIVADFIIHRELGAGGMGRVFLAHQISLDRDAALKILSTELAGSAEFIVAFIKEARSAAKLNHPNIVQAYAVGEEDGLFYFAMEYIDGVTMKDILLRDHRIPVKNALLAVEQVADALAYAWREQRLVHRDIKPDNIIVTPSGRIKLADLGLARRADDKQESAEENGDEVFGTPQYISPELLTGAPVDTRSDIYSLGATFYHMITGRFPFTGENANDIARKHLEESPVPPSSIDSSIPAPVSDMILRMMAKKPADRYQSGEEIVADIHNIRLGKSLGTVKRKITLGTATGQSRTVVLRVPLQNIRRKRTPGGITNVTSVTLAAPEQASPLRRERSLQNMKQKRELRYQSIFLLLILVSVIVFASAGFLVKWLVYMPIQSSRDLEVRIAEMKEKARMRIHAVGQSRGITASAYTAAADEILAYARENPGRTHEIMRRCDLFFLRFPERKNKFEQAKFQELLQLYAPLDEIRCEEARNRLQNLANR